eukprot:jgi/Mesvir1/12454/Mv00608-RA.1
MPPSVVQLAPPEPAPTRKLRILALHGAYASASILERQLRMAGWKRFNDTATEMISPDAPFEIQINPDWDVQKLFKPPFYNWWDDGQFSLETLDQPGALDRAMEYLVAFVEANGPFDGVFGFSMGAALGGALCLLQRQGRILQGVPRFRFLVSNCGVATSLPAAVTGDGANETGTNSTFEDWDFASFHILGGPSDPYYRQAIALREVFPSRGRVSYEHNHGHVIKRMEPELTEMMADFLAKQQGSK